MLKRNLWKLLLSLAIAVWAVTQLVPVKNVPFPTYVRAHVTAKPAEFGKLVDEATARVAAGQASSEFVALKAIAHERRIDLTQYFPNLVVESSNPQRGPAQRHPACSTSLITGPSGQAPGARLDLAGGVSVTLEGDPRAAGQERSDSARQDKLEQGDRDHQRSPRQFLRRGR